MTNIANPAFVFELRRCVLAALDDEEVSPKTLSQMLTHMSKAVRLPKKEPFVLSLMSLHLKPFGPNKSVQTRPRFDDHVSPFTGVWLDEPGKHYVSLPQEIPPLTREGYAIQRLIEALETNARNKNFLVEKSKEYLKSLLIEALEQNGDQIDDSE